MNRVHTILAVVAIAAVLVGWQVLEPEDDQGLQSSQSTGNQTDHSFQNSTNPLIKQADRVASAENSRTTETTPVWYVRTDKPICNRQTVFIPDARTGDLIEAIDCDEPKELDPYQDLDDAALASLAYGDGHAAEVLGLRLILSETPEKEAMGLGLLYRSVALSGDVETFQKAIGSRYAYLSVNGKPQIKNLKQMMVFNLIGEVLGASQFDSERTASALRAADVEQREIDEIRSGTRTILQRMADLQTEVTGNTSIREALENA